QRGLGAFQLGAHPREPLTPAGALRVLLHRAGRRGDDLVALRRRQAELAGQGELARVAEHLQPTVRFEQFLDQLDQLELGNGEALLLREALALAERGHRRAMIRAPCRRPAFRLPGVGRDWTRAVRHIGAMHDVLRTRGLEATNPGAYCGRWLAPGGEAWTVRDPARDQPIADVRLATAAEYEEVVTAAREAFLRWRETPAPVRGEYVRRMAVALREHKDALGALVSLETGKIREEGRGEVQECIDVADFAVGLSRQLYGLTIPSERRQHAMRETWHPLGVVGVITAFNFPVAVWSWNAMLALVCGDALVWKPSLKAPLSALAMPRICGRVLEPDGLGGLLGLVVGRDADVGHRLVDDRRLPLISATGSTRMGREVGQRVAARLGRSLLELGGNNAIIVLADADLDRKSTRLNS